MNGKFERKTEKERAVPTWLFLTIMLAVYETFLYVGTTSTFVFARFAVITVFALGFAMTLSFLVSLFSLKTQKRLTVILVLVLAILYIVQYFIHDAYQVFMPFDGILNGAENVATNYLDVVVGLLAKNLWKMALLLLPIFLFGKFCKIQTIAWKERICLLCAGVILYGAGVGMVYGIGLDKDKFTLSTGFNNAVNSFGLTMGIGMDMLYDGSEEEVEFYTPVLDVNDMAEKETEAPTQAPTTPVEEATEEVPATEAPTEPPKVYGYHELGLDFAAMAEAETNTKISAIHSYMASQTPAKENEYTGLFEGKNLIIITAEAFSPYVVDPERTPTLYRMMTEGVYFSDYYQPTWGSGTTGGEYSNLLSLAPYGSTKSMQEVVEQNIFHTMGKQLQARGYSSAAFHNNDYTYYSRHETHTHLGYDVFIGEGNGMENGVTHLWPQSDEEMFRYTIPQYIDQQPFSLYYMTVSGHATYTFDSNGSAKKNEEYVKDLTCSNVVKAYLACNMELEHSMAYLLEMLEEKGIMDDTVVVISTDHFPYGLEPSDTWGTNKNYLAELIGQPVSNCFIRDKSTLILWSGCLEDKDLRVDGPTMSLDILPTLSNLFGVEYDSRLMCGRDVFSDQLELAFWLDGSWKTDKGTYDGYRGKFTPAEGVELEDEKAYVESIRAIVKNKCTYSQAVTYYNYFNYVTPELEKLGVLPEGSTPSK